MLAEDLEQVLLRLPSSPATAVMETDGLITHVVGELYLPGTHQIGPAGRAVALGIMLGSMLRGDYVIADDAAAWVVLGPPESTSGSFVTALRPASRRGMRIRHSRDLPPEHVERIGGCPVTIPVRTATDLLRLAPSYQAIQTVRAFIASGHLSIPDLSREIQRIRKRPHGTRALTLLTDLAV